MKPKGSEAITFDDAIASLTQKSSLAELIDLVRNTSARVEGAPSNATSLLYEGNQGGTSSKDIAVAQAESTKGATGSDRFVVLADTDVGRLLIDHEFLKKLDLAIKQHLKITVAGFSDLPAAERGLQVTEARARILDGKDAIGNRLPVDPDPAKRSLRDIFAMARWRRGRRWGGY